MADKKFVPQWTDAPPLAGSYRALAKLGRPDQVRVPSEKYFLQLKKELALEDEDFSRRHDGNVPLGPVPSSTLDRAVLDDIAAIVGGDNVQTDDYHRVQYSHGKLQGETFNLKRGVIHEVCGAAVHPRDKGEVRKVVAYCHARKIPIYVYGGGSSVNEGFLPQRGGITLVLNTHLNKVLEVNERNHTCRVQAGCMGPDLEQGLNEAPARFHTAHRFTCGHFPQSFEISSVGGWVLALGSGQASTYYGEPATLVLGMEIVTPSGVINTNEYISTATGPRVMDMFKGSEGTLGVVVELTVKIFRYMPENRRYFSFLFPDWPSAVEATREICQAQFGLPAVMRISDAHETEHAFQMYPPPGPVEWFLARRGYTPGRRSICMGTVEGERDFTALVRRKIGRVAKDHGGMSLGGGPARSWEKDRYTSFLIAEAITDYDVVLDTVETPVRWDNLHAIHDSVTAYANSVPGTMCMSHASHFYPSGTNLYFIFGIKGGQRYLEYRSGLIEAMVKAGGSPSHHHGVGRLMHPWLERFLGRNEMDALRAVKRHFDPNNVMNPGHSLGLDAAPESKQ